MKSKKRGLIIIILASFAILADIALFILEKSGYMVGHEQPPLYYIGGVAIGAAMGAWVFKRIPGAVFRKIVYGFIGISGLIILLRA